MKFKLDSKYFMSHMVLQSRDLATEVAKTDNCTNNKELEAKLLVNGVEVNSDHIEAFLKQLWEQAQIDSGKDTFNAAVKKEAKRMLQEKADSVVSVMDDLMQKLHNADDLLDYNWDK